MIRHPGERIIVPGRRMPHQIILLFFATLVGVTFVFRQAPAPNSLERYLDARVLWAWYLMLLLGGAIGMVGSFLKRRPYQGLLAERASMILLTTAMVMYAVAIMFSAHAAGLTAGAYVLAWGASCAWRVIDIQRDLRALRVPPPRPGEPAIGPDGELDVAGGGGP